MAKNPQIKEYKLKDGSKRFMFKFYLGTDPLTGKPLSTTRRGFKSRKEAQEAMKHLNAEVFNGFWHFSFSLNIIQYHLYLGHFLGQTRSKKDQGIIDCLS